jgi:threonyl-tRNA synthetase
MAEKDDKLLKIRHSFSHVMAEAVLEIFPDAQFAIGPAIEHGFYYDFDLPRSLTPDDLEEIERRMKKIIAGKHEFVRKVIKKSEALKIFKHQSYKIELIQNLPEDEEISIYTQNSFTDLCRGPHVENTLQLNPDAFKLLTTAGAYWRGDEKNPMLQRIYGTAWETPKELRNHLNWLEEVEKRDHRKLGKNAGSY